MTQISILDAPFSPLPLLEAFATPRRGAGALASFTGYCRAKASGGEAIAALELTHYPGFTERMIADFAHPIAARCGLLDWMIVHRVGRVLPEESIVLVAALAPHRTEAFEAVETLMDFLKTDAPFWKREHRANGAHWIEPTALDHKRRETRT
ncbi:MAG: molybdenum cofactor biosynthesis protein MoaE [Hyphomonadaceae bacterium]